MAIDPPVHEKKQRALDALRRDRTVLVALSGGVDSAVLLSLALEALGPDAVLAVTGRSDAVAPEELEDARRVADQLGARHEFLDTKEMERSGYRANAGDRCYHCRTELFEQMERLSRERGFDAIAYGAIGDDTGDFRPGMTAAEERGVRAPLLEAGLTKPEVRALAAAAGLSVRDKPANPCLASRIPTGVEVTPDRLDRVGRAESALKALGFRELRVRHHGDVARLEVGPDGEKRLAEPGVREKVVEAVRGSGFRFVALDLEGLRSGSLNPPVAGKRR